MWFWEEYSISVYLYEDGFEGVVVEILDVRRIFLPVNGAYLTALNGKHLQ